MQFVQSSAPLLLEHHMDYLELRSGRRSVTKNDAGKMTTGRPYLADRGHPTGKVAVAAEALTAPQIASPTLLVEDNQSVRLYGGV